MYKSTTNFHSYQKVNKRKISSLMHLAMLSLKGLFIGCSFSIKNRRPKPTTNQVWGQVHRYLYLPVLKYIFSSTCLYFVLEFQNITKYLVLEDKREGRGAMARARSFANVTACRAVSNPAWCRIFREISCFSPLNIGTLFRCCVLGQDTLPSHASLDSGVNEYLVGQRWQCVRLVPSAEMAASAVCSKKGVEIVHE